MQEGTQSAIRASKRQQRAVLDAIEQAAGVRRPQKVTPRMTAERRQANYTAQNTRRAGVVPGGGEGLPLTPAQRRRLRHKAASTRPAQPVRQRFTRVFRMNRPETGRIGAKRFGPQLSRAQLDKLFTGSSRGMSLKGIVAGREQAGILGRLMARRGQRNPSRLSRKAQGKRSS